MKTLFPRTSPARAALLAVCALGLMASGPCRLFEEEQTEVAATAEALDADAVIAAEEVLALQQAEAVAAREAAEQAEADARAAEAELERTQQELERQRVEQAAREQRLREENALAAERARLAAERAEAEERARLLAERELEIAQREAEVAARQQAELPAYEASYEPADEPGGGFESDPDPEPSPEPDYVQATLRPGTILEIEILETLSSGRNQAGDRFVSHVAKDIYTEDGILAVPKGSEVRGYVIEAVPLKRVGGQASLTVEFTELVTPVGPPIGLRASFSELGQDKRKDKRKIIGAAVAGAILGRVLGGKGAGEVLAGAAVGAAAGTAVVARTEGQEAVIPAGEVVGLILEEVVTVTTEMTGVVQ